MRKEACMLMVLLTGITAMAQKKQRFSQSSASTAPAASYTLQLHVTRSFLTDTGNLRLVAVLNGTNVELASAVTTTDRCNPTSSMCSLPLFLLPPGNYAARVLADTTEKNGLVSRQYDLLLANGKHESFMLVGLSE